MKTIAAILFAFFAVWQPATANASIENKCCGETVFVAVSCCCVECSPVSPKPPLPVPASPEMRAPVTLLLPTLDGQILLERSVSTLIPDVAPSCATGATSLFERDCALLI